MEQDIDGEEKARGQLTGELRIKKTQHMTTSRWRHDTATTGQQIVNLTFYCRRFVEVMTEYNRIQVEYREQSKNKIKRQLEIAGKQATDEELEQMLEVNDEWVDKQKLLWKQNHPPSNKSNE